MIANGIADQLDAAGTLHITAGGHTTPLEDPTSLIDAIAQIRMG